MAETTPSRILDLSGSIQNDNEQQYVEVGSNTYLGTKDGIKYTLIETSDSKIRLVESMSDSDVSLDASRGPLQISKNNEDSFETPANCRERQTESKLIKLIAVKSEPSPCRGQGDEIGNCVISPSNSILVCSGADKELKTISEAGTQEKNAELTYTTLLPRQEKDKSVKNSYYVSPIQSYYNYTPTFPHPVAIRPTRYTRKFQMPIQPNSSTPIPRTRGRGSRGRRPRQRTYQYTPQVLHSTPTSLSRFGYNSDSTITYSESSSGSYSSSSINQTPSSFEYPRVPNNTPTSPDADPAVNQNVLSLQWMPQIATRVENYVSLDPRETHNEKERMRRLRIRNACSGMRNLVPFISDKTDNATVFEQAVYFINFMRDTVGSDHDMDFLEQHFVFE